MYPSNHVNLLVNVGHFVVGVVISFDFTSAIATGGGSDGAAVTAGVAAVVEFFCRTNALIRDPTRNANTELTNVMILNGMEPSGMGMLSNTGSLMRNIGVSVLRWLNV